MKWVRGDFYLKGGERGVCHDLSEFIHLRWKKGLCVVVLFSVCLDRGNFVVDGTRIRKIIILLGLAIWPHECLFSSVWHSSSPKIYRNSEVY